MNRDFIPPAQLFVGEYNKLISHANNYLKDIFCKLENCSGCLTCNQILARQHYLVNWIEPEGQYTVPFLESIFRSLSLSLNDGEEFFFILSKAHNLTNASASALLKSIEEPPKGYHFILLAERTDSIPATIISRCVAYNIGGQANFENNPLVAFFISGKDFDASSFAKILEQNKFSESETHDMQNFLLRFWTKKYRESLQNSDMDNSIKYLRYLEIFKNASKKMAMPGSSKIFWKNIYLKISSII